MGNRVHEFEPVRQSEAYQLFEYMENLGSGGLLNNVFKMNIAAAKQALKTRKLYYLMTGEQMQGNNYKECFALLLSHYFILLKEDGAAEAFTKAYSILSAAKFEILTTGEMLKYCIAQGSSPEILRTYSEWREYYTNSVQTYIARKNEDVNLNGTDPTKPDFPERVLLVAQSKEPLISIYRESLKILHKYSLQIAVDDLDIIDQRLTEVSQHFGEPFTEALHLDSFVDLALQMYDSQALRN